MLKKKNNYEIIRVAQVVGKLASAGVETVVNNYYRHMDHNKIRFDYIIDSDSDYTSSEEMKALGARYFIIPPTKELIARIKALEELFKENHYQIVHSHMNTLNMPVLYAAWKEHVPVRISHNHSMTNIAEGKRYLIKQFLRPTGRRFATDYFACGEAAGKWFFGKRLFNSGKVHIMPNAIDVKAFQFDQEARDRIRKELGLEDKWVIGHVGRFMKQKNHTFLIQMFAEIHNKRQDARLLLIGDGELKSHMEKLCEQFNIKDSVLFLGNRKDMPTLYSAMDLFVLPSFYEGVPVVGMEAQANGLLCLFSSNVSQELRVGNKIQILPLDIKAWVETAMRNINKGSRITDSPQIVGSQYDLNVSGMELEIYYDSVIKRTKRTNDYLRRKA